jgi:hypothetical protein
MNYAKPEVAVLGQAVRVIESLAKTVHQIFDGAKQPLKAVNPAYDLDE